MGKLHETDKGGGITEGCFKSKAKAEKALEDFSLKMEEYLSKYEEKLKKAADRFKKDIEKDMEE